MSVNVQQLAQDIVDYVDLTRDLLEKEAYEEDPQPSEEYRIKLAEAVDTMAEQQLIPIHSRMEVYDELLSRPEKVAEALCKLSQKIGPHHLGDMSDRLDSQDLDPIMQFILS